MDAVTTDLTKLLQRHIAGCAVGIALVLAATSAHASLIGASVTYELIRTDNGAIEFAETATVVDPGVEFNLFSLVNLDTRIDIGDASIHIEHFSTGSLPFEVQFAEIMQFTGLFWQNDPAAIITGVTVTSNGMRKLTNQPNEFAPSNVTFSDNAIVVDVAGYRFDEHTFIDIQIETNHDVVPEASAIALLGAGLAAFGFAARRRRG